MWKVLKAAGKGLWALVRRPEVQEAFLTFVASKVESKVNK